jgi:hypothetical protein
MAIFYRKFYVLKNEAEQTNFGSYEKIKICGAFTSLKAQTHLRFTGEEHSECKNINISYASKKNPENNILEVLYSSNLKLKLLVYVAKRNLRIQKHSESETEKCVKNLTNFKLLQRKGLKRN